MSIEVARASAVVAREEDPRILAEAEAIVRFEYLANRPVRIPFLSTRTDIGAESDVK